MAATGAYRCTANRFKYQTISPDFQILLLTAVFRIFPQLWYYVVERRLYAATTSRKVSLGLRMKWPMLEMETVVGAIPLGVVKLTWEMTIGQDVLQFYMRTEGCTDRLPVENQALCIAPKETKLCDIKISRCTLFPSGATSTNSVSIHVGLLLQSDGESPNTILLCTLPIFPTLCVLP